MFRSKKLVVVTEEEADMVEDSVAATEAVLEVDTVEALKVDMVEALKVDTAEAVTAEDMVANKLS